MSSGWDRENGLIEGYPDMTEELGGCNDSVRHVMGWSYLKSSVNLSNASFYQDKADLGAVDGFFSRSNYYPKTVGEKSTWTGVREL